LTVAQGQEGSLNVTVNAANSTLAINAAAGAAPGSYPVTITGTSGSITATAAFTLKISAAATFTLGMSAGSLMLSPNQFNTIGVTGASGGITSKTSFAFVIS
jgi:hypothetical protein